ncbi:metal dependent hydrolase of the beta-lactamase superfamily I, partial [Chlamydia psittaci 84-8471/1]
MFIRRLRFFLQG